MLTRLAFAFVAALLVAGCSSSVGTSNDLAMPTAPPVSGQAPEVTAVAAVDALGGALGTFGAYEETTEPQGTAGAHDAIQPESEVGSCKDYREFFVPDKHNDPNSTESIWFYNAKCTEVARDVVRLYTATGAHSESVKRTATFYALGNDTPIAVNSGTNAFENATFSKNGDAITSDGFDSSGTSQLAISGANTVSTGHELVMLAASGNTNSFCGDSAGFDAYGVPPTNDVFGWGGGTLSGGTRTKNADGSVTWVATRSGTASEGKPNAFSLSSGSENTSCPITTPMWTVSGGTSVGSYSLPTTATYLHGILSSLAIANGVLPGGTMVNVSTTPGAHFSSSTFMTGTISESSNTIATFGVDAFGNGTLTISSSGKQFLIEDWQVVK